MAQSSSNKKVQRAARTASSSKGAGERRRLGFPMALVAVVILGVALVVFARPNREPAAAPRVGNDHWHSALRRLRLRPVAAGVHQRRGPRCIHSHQDGVIHIHPWNSSAAGDRADLDVFFESMGVRVSDDEISGPGIGVLEAGSDCNGEPTIIRAARFARIDPDALDPDDDVLASGLGDIYEIAEEYTDDFGDIKLLGDLEAFTFARLPAGAEIPPPPRRCGFRSRSLRRPGTWSPEGPRTDLEPTDSVPAESG